MVFEFFNLYYHQIVLMVLIGAVSFSFGVLMCLYKNMPSKNSNHKQGNCNQQK